MKNLEFFTLRDNKKKVLRSIYENAPTSRTEITKRTNLSKVSVARFVNQFIREGLIYESELDVSSGGRRPALIKLIPESKLIVAVDFGLESVRFGLCDLKLGVKKIIGEEFEIGKFEIGKTRGDFIDLTKEGLEQIKKTKDYQENKILGIGISLPGVIDTEKGKIIQSFLLRDKNVELKREIAKSFETQILIDNDANSGLYSEKWLGVGRNYDNILYVYTRNYEKGQMGAGVSFYLDGKIYRGSNYASGEIGLARKREEREEIFEPFSSYEVMPSLERLVRMRPLKEKTLLKQLLKRNELNFATIIEAARQGDRQAEVILEDIGTKIGRGVAYLVNLINPQLVIIGGDFARAPERFHESLKKAIVDYGFDFSIKNLEIKSASKMDGLTGLRQAAFLVVGSLLGYE